MPKYYTDFSDFIASDWAVRWVDQATLTKTNKVGSLNGHAVTINNSTTARIFYEYTKVPNNIQNVEVLARISVTSTGTLTGTPFPKIRICGNNLPTSQTAYYASFDYANGWFIAEYVQGVYSLITQSGASTPKPTSNEWYWVRFRKNSVNLYLKWWKDGEVEPNDWILSAQDTSISDGSVGIGSFTSGHDKNFDVFSVATDGETADSLHLAPPPPPDIVLNGQTTFEASIVNINVMLKNSFSLQGDSNFTAQITNIYTQSPTAKYIEGLVTYQGNPIQGAIIKAISNTGNVHEAVSGVDGVYTLSNLMGDEYHLMCTYKDANGNKFSSVSKPFVIPMGG